MDMVDFVPPRNYYAAVVDSPNTTDVIRSLLTEIIPNRNLAEFQRLVEEGAVTPFTAHPDYPLASSLNMVLSIEDADKQQWLKVLFSRDPAAVTDKNLKVHSFGYYASVTALRSYDGGSIFVLPFSEFLRTKMRLSLDFMIDISPSVLGMEVQEGNRTVPLFHQVMGEFQTFERYEALEKKVGNANFLNLVDDHGETLFYKIVTMRNFCDERRFHDIATWMLTKNPDLVNTPDRLGWTPLDRHVTEAIVNKENNDMLGLLLAAGAKFNRQIAPHFNVAAEVDKQRGEIFEKAPLARGLTTSRIP